MLLWYIYACLMLHHFVNIVLCDVLNYKNNDRFQACNALEPWVRNSIAQHKAQHVYTATHVKNRLKLLLLASKMQVKDNNIMKPNTI